MRAGIRISRVLVALAGVAFAGVALAAWTAPQRAAWVLGLAVTDSAGAATIRADIGGLFAGLALLSGAALSARHPSAALTAAGMLAAIVTGRVVGWIGDGRVGSDAGALAVEACLLSAFVVLARAARR